MRRLQQWAAVLDDRLNPVLIKELRQAVRARFVGFLLVVFLILMMTILGGFLVNIDPDDHDYGLSAFLSILGVLQVATTIFVPGFVAARISQERTSGELRLILATALEPGAVIRGKLLSGMVIALLLYSIATPFMTFTYLLRGIDLPTIFIYVGLSYLLVAPAVQFAVLVACLPTKPALRYLALVFCGLVGIYAVPVLGIIGPMELGIGELGSRILDRAVWLPLLGCVTAGGLTVALLYSLACAAVASPASNRARPVRLTMSISWLLGGLVAAVWAIAEDDKIILFWYYSGIVIFGLAMLAGVSQRDQLGARLRRTIPGKLWQRLPAFFFFSGSAAGLSWAIMTVILTLLTLLAGQLGDAWNLRYFDEHLRLGAAIAIYAFTYALAGLGLQRRLLYRWLHQRHTWAIGLGLLAFSSLLSLLIETLVYAGVRSGAGLRPWRVLAPFSLGDEVVVRGALWFGAMVILLVIVLGRTWFMTQVRAFRPLPQAAKERAR